MSYDRESSAAYLFQLGAPPARRTELLDPGMPTSVVEEGGRRTLGLTAMLRGLDAYQTTRLLEEPEWRSHEAVTLLDDWPRDPRIGDLILLTRPSGPGLFQLQYSGWRWLDSASLAPAAQNFASLLDFAVSVLEHAETPAVEPRTPSLER